MITRKAFILLLMILIETVIIACGVCAIVLSFYESRGILLVLGALCICCAVYLLRKIDKY